MARVSALARCQTQWAYMHLSSLCRVGHYCTDKGRKNSGDKTLNSGLGPVFFPLPLAAGQPPRLSDLKAYQDRRSRGLTDSLVVKSMFQFSGGPEFSSQHPLDSLQLPVTPPASGDPTPFYGFCGHLRTLCSVCPSFSLQTKRAACGGACF